MKLFDCIKYISKPVVVLIAFLLALCAPNVVLCITEHMSLLAAVANVMLPMSVYLFLLSLNCNVGKIILMLLPIIALCSFQIVLFFLYGSSIIGVDMFLNVVTTTSSEAFELLNNLGPALIVVFILYLPPLVWSTINLFKKILLGEVVKNRIRVCSVVCTCIGLIFLLLSYIFVADYSVSQHLFPLNVIKNMSLAVDRINQNNNYYATSSNFCFNAMSTHTGMKELYVVVIGETGRADNYGLLGYSRNTTPLLSKTPGVVSFKHVLSESNTTHKSVPMLLSLISAENYDSINYQKSIITAFKEAGFYTAFLSSQPLNRSYIDYFANEADYVNYINKDKRGKECLKDEALLKELDKVLFMSSANDKRVIFMHTYGSHFSYSDRYNRNFAYFVPDNTRDASVRNRSDLINAYDNTIRYTDYLLHCVIQRLSQSKDVLTAMMYTTDHGEDIFDDRRERFLHASPTPTYWQLHVPMLLWISNKYNSVYPDKWNNIVAMVEQQVSSSRSFAPTVLDIAGIVSSRINMTTSVASSSYVSPQRVYVSDRNKSLPLCHSGFDEIDYKLMNNSDIK
jgi:glucan phosphoethanolaminetransferase (alkaline phosphatase superfamily)